MAQIIGLPKLSPTMEEGVLLKWVKKEGDKVSPGDLVAEVETDKANMDFNMEDSGTILKLLVGEGATVKLGAPVAILGKPGEDIAALLTQALSGGNGASTTPAVASAPASAAKPAASAPTASVASASVPAAPVAATPPPVPAASNAQAGTVLASPLAKSLAVELGIDLRKLKGSGPGGRIVERDVRAAAGGIPQAAPIDHSIPIDISVSVSQPVSQPIAAMTPQAPAATALAVGQPRSYFDGYTDEPASNMRRRIAARLTEAKRDVPHFYLQRQVNAAPMLAFRQRLNDLLGDRGKVSVNDLIVKATALALRRVPGCNASWEGDAIRRYHGVHIGIAVAIDDGLVTPVVRDADLKGIGAIAAEVRDLADRAKKRGLKAHEISGSTFTISNLGMFGIERFTAIINPPEAGILAVGAVQDVPVVENGAVVPGKRLMLTMSCDHRVIDGALGSQLLAALTDLLEHPEALAL